MRSVKGEEEWNKWEKGGLTHEWLSRKNIKNKGDMREEFNTGQLSLSLSLFSLVECVWLVSFSLVWRTRGILHELTIHSSPEQILYHFDMRVDRSIGSWRREAREIEGKLSVLGVLPYKTNTHKTRSAFFPYRKDLQIPFLFFSGAGLVFSSLQYTPTDEVSFSSFLSLFFFLFAFSFLLSVLWNLSLKSYLNAMNEVLLFMLQHEPLTYPCVCYFAKRQYER